MRQFIDDEAEWNGTSAGELPITFEVGLAFFYTQAGRNAMKEQKKEK